MYKYSYSPHQSVKLSRRPGDRSPLNTDLKMENKSIRLSRLVTLLLLPDGVKTTKLLILSACRVQLVGDNSMKTINFTTSCQTGMDPHLPGTEAEMRCQHLNNTFQNGKVQAHK